MSGSGGKGRGNGGKGSGNKKGKGKNHGQKHNHPGGSAAVLGARIAKYSSIQGGSLVLTNVLHAASIIYVARQLGPGDLGRYSLLLFLSGLITQVFHIFSKPGTLRRVFGQADDDDAGAEGDFGEGEEDEAAESPQRSLGVGLVWVSLLGLAGALITIILRRPIAEMLLGDPDQTRLIFWAGILGGVGAIFKLADIVIWFERRPITFVIVDAMRPALNLAIMAYLVSKGRGVEGAIEGAAIGTSIATVIALLALVRSFELAFNWAELKLILLRGVGRVPIAMSMWMIQNADTFILSRYVDHKQVGYYKLAQNLGFVVSFLPQGFRIALRPLRKSALFQAVRDQYGTGVAKGQLLVYFCLISMVAILMMVLGGTLILDQASPRFQQAAPLIPLTAAAMTMPALFRTINGQTFFPHKRAWFIGSVIWAAISFVGWMWLLVHALGFGIIGTPIAAILAFGSSCVFLWIRGQRGPSPIDFPYGSILRAFLIGVAIAVFDKFVHPANKWLELSEVGALMLLYIFLLFATRVVPVYHRAPLWHIARSTFSRSPHGFDRQVALSSLGDQQRRLLQEAVVDRIPVEVLDGSNGAGADGGNGSGGDGEGAQDVAPERLVKILRKAGAKGGMKVGKVTDHDARIAKFLFADSPTAARNATMRSLVSAGANSNDLRALEDLVEYLAKTPRRAWEGKKR
jgi:O-antigen/teichoic acid export membrane protein